MKCSARVLLIVTLAAAVSEAGCTRKRELGNVLRVAVREKYKSLDPAHGGDFYSNVEISRAYEGLLRLHYLKRPYELEPALAESMPAVSKDQLTYTFKIRKGVLFQDDAAFTQGKGRELVAADFVYSFKRLADPKTVSEGWWTLDGKIAGLNEWREAAVKTGKANYDVVVEGLVAPDAQTLVVRLKKPLPQFLQLLTTPTLSVVAREAVEAYGLEFRSHPVGTGAFQLQTLTPNQLIWVRNPTFHGQAYPSAGGPGDKEAGLLEDAGKPIPFVDKLVDDLLVEDQPTWLNFMQGGHDYLGQLPKDNVAAVFDSDGKPSKELRDKGIEVHATPGVWFNYFVLNQDDPALGGEKNRYLRQAMSLAYDEAPTIEKFYLGLAARAESPIPPGIRGYDAGYKNPMRQYDLIKARDLLAKHGHPGGEGLPELTYDTIASTTYRQIAEYFQRQMAQLGVKVKVNECAWPELQKRIHLKQGQIWGVSWLYDFPDAENGWQNLYSKNAAPGSNYANYRNPKFDALYEKSAVTEDGPERNKLFAKMKDLLVEDVPWILTVHRMETRLTHSWLKNFKVHSFEHDVDKYLRVDTQGREQALKRGIR